MTNNARWHGKDVDQAVHHLCESVHPHTFVVHDHSHRTVGGVRSKWKGTPQTNGGDCRPGGESLVTLADSSD